MNKTIRYIMYVVITIICIISVFVGVYAVELRIAKDQRNEMEESIEKGEETKKKEKSTTDKFRELFTNEFFGSESIESEVKKIEKDKAIVYKAWNETVNKEGKYSIDVHLPGINIDSDVARKYNEKTSQDFISQVELLKSESNKKQQYTIYETSFTSYVNEDILSVAIMASLKEGGNAQRVIVKTYNYNLKTGEDVPISEIIEKRGLDTTAINKKINSTVKEAAEEAESVSQTGYSVYKRNIEDEMYSVKNVTNYIQGPNGELFIIYAYGEKSNTAEMDVIEI